MIDNRIKDYTLVFVIALVFVYFQSYGTGKTELEAKVWYLTCVKQFPLFGCTLFPIVHKGLWQHAHDALLAINMDGVKFVRAKDKCVLHDFRYSDIESISLDPNDNYVTMELKNAAAKDCPQRCFMFETNHKEDLGNLIASYSPAHAAWLKPDYEGVKKVCHLVLHVQNCFNMVLNTSLHFAASFVLFVNFIFTVFCVVNLLFCMSVMSQVKSIIT